MREGGEQPRIFQGPVSASPKITIGRAMFLIACYTDSWHRRRNAAGGGSRFPRSNWQVAPAVIPARAAFLFSGSRPRPYGVTLTKLETGPVPAALMALTR